MSAIRRVPVIRTHLELRDPSQLRTSARPQAEARVVRVRPDVAGYRAMYREVGERWHWRDRLALTESELAAYLANPAVAIWELRVDGDFAGYFELFRHDEARTEIMYFGLLPRFIGRRLGGWMLTRAVEEAFAGGARHVTLHTCTLDAPSALPNYLARGFRIVREETYEEDVLA